MMLYWLMSHMVFTGLTTHHFWELFSLQQQFSLLSQLTTHSLFLISAHRTSACENVKLVAVLQPACRSIKYARTSVDMCGSGLFVIQWYLTFHWRSWTWCGFLFSSRFLSSLHTPGEEQLEGSSTYPGGGTARYISPIIAYLRRVKVQRNKLRARITYQYETSYAD